MDFFRQKHSKPLASFEAQGHAAGLNFANASILSSQSFRQPRGFLACRLARFGARQMGGAEYMARLLVTAEAFAAEAQQEVAVGICAFVD